MLEETNTPQNTNDLTQKIVGALKTALNGIDKGPIDEQYIVEYRKTDDGSLIGYHASTFCQLVLNPHDAKRYSGLQPYKQLQTISKNLKDTLEVNPADNGIFGSIANKIKAEHFPNLKFEDIYLEACYINESYPKQKFTITVVGE